MKILICASEYYPYGSGIANVAYNVVEQLKKMGVDCTVCSPTGPEIKLGSSKLIEKTGIIGLLYYWHRVFKYFKGQENDFDVVWHHNPLFLKRNPFQRSIITIHTTYYGKVIQELNPKMYNKVASAIERYCLNKINEKARFTAVSPQVCKELDEIGVSKQRMIYIPNGADTKLFKPSDKKKSIRKKFGIPEDDLIFLSLGRLSKAKQPFKLIKVFSVIEKVMDDVTLVITGKGELSEKTKEFSRQKNWKNIIFLGYVDERDKPPLYACSDYYIITSKYEGQPLTLMEAMSSGLPCIVSDIPNLRVVDAANCGIIVNFDDIGKAAADIIGYLYKDKSENSKNAREYAVNNLDWQIIAGRYLEEFEKIVFEKEGQ
ncbi:Glycosyltransferase involved in cell wall bisynthesis [Candidatus Methanophagaceae archaeon]|nr:Glycosyltransferase involved in cell wall bisynthesis [Methanophagales archaeon]